MSSGIVSSSKTSCLLSPVKDLVWWIFLCDHFLNDLWYNYLRKIVNNSMNPLLYGYHMYIPFTVLKVTNVRVVITHFLKIPFSSKVQSLWREYFVINNSFTQTIWNNVKCRHLYPIIDFILIFNLIWRYITSSSYVGSVIIFFGLKSSYLVSGLYALMQRILYVIFIAPYCNITVPLVKQCVITKGP